MKKKLNIFAGDLLVGYLSESTAKGMSFVYAPAWLANADAMSLSSDLPLSDQTYHGEPVVAFFENLLPEGDVLEFISKAIQISSGNTFGLLERFGGDTAGAFSLLPEGMRPSHEPHYLPVRPQDILEWFQRSRGIPLNINGEQARMSLSGAQDKMTVFIDSKGNVSIPLGAAPSSHIIKPSVKHRQDVPCTAINEAMVMMLARRIKLEVADVRYWPELSAVVVARYDREIDKDNRLHRLHQNDLCQVLGVPSSMKYESEGGPSLKTCFEAVLKHSSQPAIDKRRLIEWVIFNFLVGNMDGHAKNLSLMTAGKNTQLAPFYDMVCTAVYGNLSQKFAFKIGGENRPKWMMARHWGRFATDIGVKPQYITKAQLDIMNRIESALPSISEELSSFALSNEELDMISKIRAFITKSVTQMKMRIKDTHFDSASSQDSSVDEAEL
ncbi:type II toxin-antitoxin system HipA family toxin [Methylicorpusculum oleiharenae]|uniref:type II toxin-antitoxin system HipA family toxin n=1 Tax=Methylicorpusculum oleiharenae TaxID=1338687 RepID=UPI00135AC5E9|nr:type II toxin-antitoxin system HipA family toxin [Methylicorpusculum oleiharenae]MCD2448845.1 type II toxin-antitoxin system HipA family toxin [Methylicorpusculum oleiharenae]